MSRVITRKVAEKLTQLPLVNLFRCESKHSQHFDQYLDYRLRHRRSVFNLPIGINLEAPCEVLDTFENIHKGIVACSHVLCRLADTDITTDELERSNVRRTERSIPIPEKITFAGGNAYSEGMYCVGHRK